MTLSTSNHARSGAVAILLLFLLAACADDDRTLFEPHYVESQQEAGAINLAVTLVAPWEEYISALSPNFSLDAEGALQKAIPQTTVLEEKILDSLGASVRLGLSGQLPEEPGAAPGAERAPTDFPGVPEEKKTVGKDPMLEYTVASALYQEVQLLNRYVTDAALRRDHKAYVVRLQVGVMPYARNQPYDVYITLAFFAETPKDEEYAEAYVVPLLVTDNLEGALTSRSLDTIRQFALALSFLTPGVAGGVELNRLREEFQSVLGTDINSLLTVGRVTDNTIQIRLGASQQPSAGYAMIPRTHNITLVVTVPNEFAAHPEPRIRVVASTIMRDVKTGVALPQRLWTEEAGEIEMALAKYFADGLPAVENGFCRKRNQEGNCTPEDRKRNAIRSLIVDVIYNNFDEFVADLKAAGWYHGLKRNLWLEIVENFSRNEFAGVQFELPRDIGPDFPNDQEILLLDDPNKQMTASLSGGRGLIPDRMSATLHLKLEDGTILPFVAQSISVKPGGRDPVFTFPSLAALKIQNVDLQESWLSGSDLTLAYVMGGKWQKGTDENKQPFSKVLYQKVAVAPEPSFTMRTALDSIAAKEGSVGTLKLHIESKKDENNKPLVDWIEITLKNADIDKVISDKEGELDLSLGKITVKMDATLTLTLSNLIEGKTVTIKGTGKKDGKAVGGPHPDITLTIGAAPKAKPE